MKIVKPDPSPLIKKRELRNVVALDDIPNLRKRLESTLAEIKKLGATADLDDEAALASIGRLQLVAYLIPLRIAAEESKVVAMDTELIKAANDFAVTLARFISDVEVEARKKARTELRPHFSDGPSLESAVQQSAVVRSVLSMAASVRVDVNPVEGLDRYVQTLAALPSKVEEFALAHC